MTDTASLITRVSTQGVEEADKQLEDFAMAAAAAAGESAALERAAKKMAAEEKKTATVFGEFSAVAEQLGNKIVVLNEAQVNGARSAYILSQQMRAAASASQAEIDTIGQLAGKLYDMSTATKQAAANQDSFVKSSGRGKQQLQQAGYQVQDFIVQVQGGTSAFVAFGQQGSQLAGALGPGGAVLGAVIALGSVIGGALYKSLGDATVGTEELEKAQRSLQSTLKTGSGGVQELTDEFVKLAAISNTAAQAKLAAGLADAQTQIKAAGQAAAEASKQFDSLFSGNVFGAAADLARLTNSGQDTAEVLQTISTSANATAKSVQSLRSFTNDLSGDLGITKEQALGLVTQLRDVERTKSPEAVQNLAKSTADLQAQYGTANAKLNNFNNVLQQAVLQMAQGKSAAEALQAAYDNLGATLDKIKRKQEQAGESFVRGLENQSKRGAALIQAQTAETITAIQQREDLTADQQKRAIAAAQKAGDVELNELRTREKQKTDAQEKAAQNRIDAQAKKDASAAAQQRKSAESFLATLERSGSDQVAKIDATERQKLETTQKYLAEGAISQSEYEKAVTDIRLNAEDARNAELEKRRQAEIEKSAKHDDFINQTQALNATELDLLDIQERAKEEMAQKYRDKGYINEQEYQEGLAQIQQAYNKKRIIEYSNMLGTTTDNLKAALGEGNKAYKAFAIANAIMNTYQGAVAAFQSAAAIPIIGWVAAPIAAAAAVAAGLANVAKIRAAREQGGNLSAGQMSTIAERGKPEVIMPASASRVRTAQQMRQIMGENNGSGSRSDSVVIVNNTTGRIDNATTERDDEGRLRVIINETVSAALGDSNSDISKARRGTRGLPGY